MKVKLGKKISTYIMAVLIAASLIPSAAEAGGRGHHGGPEGGCGMNCGMMRGHHMGCGPNMLQDPKVAQELGLTEEQLKKLDEAHAAVQEKQMALKEEMDNLRSEMDQAFAADPIDDKTVLQISESIAAVKGKMTINHTELQLAIRKLLTAEQAEKMKSIQANGCGRGCNGPDDTGKPCNMNGGQGCKAGCRNNPQK